MQTTETTLETVREYYGSVLQGTRDLKTSACCPTDALPEHVRSALENVDDEIAERFYGCGSPFPVAVDGAAVLDLGCGTGRDVYVASQLVGEKGFVIGVDMTEDQLSVARRHVDSHTERFGYGEPNVEFRRGYIEDLRTAEIKDESVDVVISNCVVNLSPEKRSVFEEIFRVLRPGGELYFSDVFADRRVPAEVASNPVLYGECLGGALYTGDFKRLMTYLGCQDVRIVSTSSIEIDDPDLNRLVGNIRFSSRTIRAFKLPGLLEDACEDYGQLAYYLGTIPETPHVFELDDHHRFEAGRPVPVCGNTAAMLGATRYGRFFDVVGDRSVHYGAFDCAPASDAGTVSSCTC